VTHHRVVRRLVPASAVFAFAGLIASWSVAQTTGAAPSAPPAAPPPAPVATPAPAATPAAPAVSAPAPAATPAAPAAPAPAAPAAAPSPAAPAAEVVQPSSFPQKLPPKVNWTFSGFFGTFDQAQLQRGYQVYKEVCSNCHSMDLVAFRNLGDAGGPDFSQDEVKALAASYMVTDGPDDSGQPFQRPGRPSDYLQAPYANPQAAIASLGAAPPDLSVIAKARAADRGLLSSIVDFFTGYQEAGPDYIHALLTGFTDPPPGVQVPMNTYYNPYFLNAVSLKMPPPLMDGLVEYTDGSPMTTDQYAKDVSAFLMWTAEPHLVERKEIGFRVFIFLIVFAGLMYATKRKVWSKVAH
jgi:ubiquinol-cytochrome c reductase cytochrome c1 subunit